MWVPANAALVYLIHLCAAHRLYPRRYESPEVLGSKFATHDSETLPPNVAVRNFGLIAFVQQSVRRLFRQADGAVMAARAANGDGEVAFSLPHVLRQQIQQEAHQ